MHKQLLTILLAFTLVIVSVNATTITELDVTITSDKDTYYCEPVIYNEGCLIQSQITVENNRVGAINPILEFDANKDVTFRSFRNDGLQIATEKSYGKNIHSKQPYFIASGETKTYDLEFYVRENGKFNFTAFFLGQRVILDPFFNTSYSPSTPTLYLEQGLVSSDADSSFSVITNLTTELSDNSDITQYEINQPFTVGATNVYNSHDMVGDSNTADMNVNGEGFFTNISIGTQTDIQSIEFCFLSNTFAGTPLPNMSIALNVTDGENPIRLNGFDTPITTDTWLCDTIDSAYFPYFEANTDVVVGLVCDNCDGANKFKIRRDDDGTKGVFDVDDSASPTWGSDLTRSLMINLTITTGTTELNGDALRGTYPITFNTDNKYWLKTRKTNTGVQQAHVYLYNDGTDTLNSLVGNFSIVTGNDTIPLTITQNITASVRLFTTTPANISELFLIEGINDSVAPTVIVSDINNTALSCGDSIYISANVTDDNQVQQVILQWQDNISNVVEADELLGTNQYFIERTYTHFTVGTEYYNYTLVNATDLVGNEQTTNPSLQFTYTCIAPDITPPTIFPSDVNNSLIDLRVTNQTVNYTVTDNIGIVNTTITLFNASGVQAQIIFYVNGSPTFFNAQDEIDISPFGAGIYNVQWTAYDTSNNFAELLYEITIVDFDVFTIAISPDNNAHLSFTEELPATIPFVYSVGSNSSCELLFNESIITSQSAGLGSNTINLDFRTYSSVNATVEWKVSCEVTGFGEFNSTPRILSVDLLPAITEEFDLNSCPNTDLTNVIFYLVLLFIAFMLMVFDVALVKAGVFGFLGGFLLLALSFPLYYCIGVWAITLTLGGTMGIVYFLARGLRNGGFSGIN